MGRGQLGPESLRGEAFFRLEPRVAPSVRAACLVGAFLVAAFLRAGFFVPAFLGVFLAAGFFLGDFRRVVFAPAASSSRVPPAAFSH